MPVDPRDSNEPCLDEERILDYVRDRLSPAEAESIEQHYLACDRCWEQVEQALELRDALTALTEIEGTRRDPKLPRKR